MRLAFAIAVALLALPAAARDAYTQLERPIADRLCAGMEREVRMPNGDRADCTSATHAIEVELAQHWKSAIGQAVSYAAATGKRPGIILVCEPGEDALCLKASLGIREGFSHFGLPLTLWECAIDAQELGQCLRRECDSEGCD